MQIIFISAIFIIIRKIIFEISLFIKETKERERIEEWYNFSHEISKCISRMSDENKYNKSHEIGNYLNYLYENPSLEKSIRESQNVMKYKEEVVTKWGQYFHPDDFARLRCEIRNFKLDKLV